AGRGVRAAVDEGDPAGVARDGGSVRPRGDAAPGPDRLGGLRERGRQGGPARLRGEAQAGLPRPVTDAGRPPPAADAWDGAARLRLAAATRSLLDVVVGLEARDAALDDAADTTERVVAGLRERGRERSTRPPGPRRHAE